MRTVMLRLKMKTLLLVVFAFSGGILKAGPPDAEKQGLDCSTYMKLSDSQLKTLETQAKAILKATFLKSQPKKLKPLMEPVDWYNDKEELCQIRWGGELSKEEFDECFQKADWKIIETPEFYLSAMHLPAQMVVCYDGRIDKHPAHLLWLQPFGQFMIVVELKKA